MLDRSAMGNFSLINMEELFFDDSSVGYDLLLVGGSLVNNRLVAEGD